VSYVITKTNRSKKKERKAYSKVEEIVAVDFLIAQGQELTAGHHSFPF